MADEYYMEDTRSRVGNSMMWWRKGGKGYACDVREAEVWNKEDAERQHLMRETDRPWPKAYIDSRISHHIDFQHCEYSQSDAPAKPAAHGTGGV